MTPRRDPDDETPRWPARARRDTTQPIVPTMANNHQRQMTVQRAQASLERFMQADQTVSHLRGHIVGQLEAFPKAARYDDDAGGRGTAELTPVERGASDPALRDLGDLDHYLGVLDYAIAGLLGLEREYRVDPRVQRQADPNACPAGMCQDHWAAAHFDVPIAEGRYRKRCRWCGEWFAQWGQRCPKPVLDVLEGPKGKRGLTTAIIREHAPYALEAAS
ncbi:hypothetical protein PO878_04025 [Iamia majanohamensis]|uniref:Uncharacterized protein n=1 Tax=Iamia majanohamensis TaxID=467976 RepID=A0AAE9Y716_9ACTN|nr:hypothetical protein [Iamia majanohamensis]WCO67890.1 hypothetical protein PO878_04025 [Iamia majanohamensis]